ncbi:MAG: methylated-DNA--[protein]-cysteine S-methyltransferase [Hyphomicrobiales bacterium]|nr:methylated-DNA--[protein]-cysteine S-methyltransferase [Hyphomicrobiales bacterium]
MPSGIPSACFGGTFTSPIGPISILSNGDAITRITFDTAPVGRSCAIVSETMHCLRRYFDGKQTDFQHIPLIYEGTAFQQAVWQALTRISYGKTLSYRDIAQAIGRPSAFRAVGQACNRNPIPMIIPCHRVVGSNGALTGFAGGISSKQWLLAHEQALTQQHAA